MPYNCTYGWRCVSTNIKQPLAIGYLATAALAIIPRIALEALAGRFNLPPAGQGSHTFVVFSVTIAFLLCMLRPLQLVFRKHPEPLRQLGRDFAAHWPWLITVAAMVLIVPETLDVATRLKKLIPQIQPFYADRFLVDAEYRLLGSDAWRLTHAVLGAFATRAIDLVYGLWHAVNIGLLCWMVLTRDRRFQLQAVLSYQLAWLLMGGIMAISFASVGPCFYEHFTGDPRFDPLMSELRDVAGPLGLHSLVAMKYLVATEGTDSFGGGISAMPSLHVGIATMVVLVATHVCPRNLWVKLAATLYAITIFVGSVHLGWHYALDGIVAAAGMLAIWRAVAWMLGRLFGNPAGSAAAPQAA